MRRIIPISIVLLLALATGCSKPTAPSEAANTMTMIQGTVTDTAGNGIPGVAVEIHYYYYDERHMLKPASAKACSLFRFYAGWGPRYLALHWQDTLENGTYQWQLMRSYKGGNPPYQVIATLPGMGTSSLRNSYTYVDSSGTNGKLLYYWLDEVDQSAVHTHYGPCILYYQTTYTDENGRYTLSNVPIDSLIPVYSSSNVLIRTDNIGSSFMIWPYKSGYDPSEYLNHYFDINKNTFNQINFVLHPQ